MPLPPSPGMLSDIPTKVGPRHLQSLWDSSQLGVETTESSAESRRSLCTPDRALSLTCLLLPEPQPPHLQLHTAPVSILWALCSRQALRGPHACPCLPILLAGPLPPPSLPLPAHCPTPATGPRRPHHPMLCSPSSTSCDLSPCFLREICSPLAPHPGQDPVPPALCTPLLAAALRVLLGLGGALEVTSDPRLPLTWAGGTCPELCTPLKPRPSALHPAQPRCILCLTKAPGACGQKVTGAAPEQWSGVDKPYSEFT